MNEKAQAWLFCTLGGHFDHSVVLNRASNLKCTKQKKIWYQDWEIYLWRKYNFVSKMIIYGFGIYFHNMQKVTRRGKFSISVLVTAGVWPPDCINRIPWIFRRRNRDRRCWWHLRCVGDCAIHSIHQHPFSLTSTIVDIQKLSL